MFFLALRVSPYFLGLDRGDAFDVGCDYVDLLLHAAELPGIFSVNATEKLPVVSFLFYFFSPSGMSDECWVGGRT